MFVLSFRPSLRLAFRGVLGVVALALAAAGFLALPATAAAAQTVAGPMGGPAAGQVVGPVRSCSHTRCTVRYTTVGTGQSFTVPARVTSLSVTLYGGRGGDNGSGVLAGTARG